MWQYVQKRHSSQVYGHGPTPHPVTLPNSTYPLPPVAPENEGRTGYGELRGELRNIMGGPTEELDTFPESMGKLERGQWYPYSRRSDYPPMVSTSAEQNQRIWTEMHMEQLMDHHPPHEVHASELPDYHYFPPIVRELDHKLAAEKAVNQRLTNHVQVLDLHLEDKDLLIAEQQQRIQALQAQLMEQEQDHQQSEFGGKFDIKFEEEVRCSCALCLSAKMRALCLARTRMAAPTRTTRTLRSCGTVCWRSS